MKKETTNLIRHKKTERDTRSSRAVRGPNMLKGFTLMLVMTLMVMGCDSIVDQNTEADVNIATSDMTEASVVDETPITCIDPNDLEYNKVTESKIAEWGNPRNPFSKTVDIEYYNTLEQFVLRVKSSGTITDVLVDDESIKDFDGTIEADTWQEFTFDLDPDWEAGDTQSFSLKIAGSGPLVLFDVDYTLLGECVYYTLSLVVKPAGVGTVTGGGDYLEEAVTALEATANEGWDFINWTDGTDIEISTSANFNYTMPAANVTLTANYVSSGTWPRDTQTTVVDVVSVTGRTWMDRNLGASRAAISSTDSDAYGDLYQWGRAADGHQIKTSTTTTTKSDSDQPDHGKFILNNPNSSPYDWRIPQNDDLWNLKNGAIINNPCPIGYRLPTISELDAERLSWVSNDPAGAYKSPLKLPLAGTRNGVTGTVREGTNGLYWSSTITSNVGSMSLYFEGNQSFVGGSNRSSGFSVRCTKD